MWRNLVRITTQPVRFIDRDFAFSLADLDKRIRKNENYAWMIKERTSICVEAWIHGWIFCVAVCQNGRSSTLKQQFNLQALSLPYFFLYVKVLNTTFPQTDAIFAGISSLLWSTILLNIHLTLSDKLCRNKTNNCAFKENYSPSAKLQPACSYTVFQIYHKWNSKVLIKFNNISPQLHE